MHIRKLTCFNVLVLEEISDIIRSFSSSNISSVIPVVIYVHTCLQELLTLHGQLSLGWNLSIGRLFSPVSVDRHHPEESGLIHGATVTWSCQVAREYASALTLIG